MAAGHSLNDLELLILLALIRLAPEAYGVPIAREIEARAKRSIALSTVYSILERLEKKGLVKSELGEATAERGGRAKRYFQVTGLGVREVRSTRQALMGMWQGIPAFEGGTA
jgi:DNA-binding PadR family transcriptional regulator